MGVTLILTLCYSLSIILFTKTTFYHIFLYFITLCIYHYAEFFSELLFHFKDLQKDAFLIYENKRGALYGLNYSTMVASKFDYNTSILILVYVVLGGLGNINGTLISTVVLFLLPQLLRGLQDYRMLIYAVILIVIMLVTNNNVLKTKMGSLRRKKA